MQVDIQLNDLGEGLGLARVGTQLQLWVDFCGPNSTEHRDHALGLAATHGLRCTQFFSENTDGCREGLICTNVQSTEELSQLGAEVVSDVFKISGNPVVRYRYY